MYALYNSINVIERKVKTITGTTVSSVTPKIKI